MTTAQLAAPPAVKRGGTRRRNPGGQPLNGPANGLALMRTAPFAVFAAWATFTLPGSGLPGAFLLTLLAWAVCPVVFMASLRNPWRQGHGWIAQRTLLGAWRVVDLDRISRLSRSKVSALLTTHSSIRIDDDNGGWVRVTDHSAWDSDFVKVLGPALKKRGWNKALWFDGPDAYLLYQELSGDRRPRKRHAGAWENEKGAHLIGQADMAVAAARGAAVPGFVDGSAIPAGAISARRSVPVPAAVPAAAPVRVTAPARLAAPVAAPPVVAAPAPAAPSAPAVAAPAAPAPVPAYAANGFPEVADDDDDAFRVTPPVLQHPLAAMRAPGHVPTAPSSRSVPQSR